MIDLNKKLNHNQCFLSKDDDPWLWHRRIAHINMEHLNKLISKDLVIGLPKLKFEKDRLCDACQKGKQGFHLNLRILFQHPSRTMSFGGNYYAFVIIDDYSRYTWTLFITHKSDTFHAFKKLAKIIQNKKNLKIASIRSDHGVNLKTKILNYFVMNMALSINFLHLEPLNKMELLRGKIGHWNRLLELY